MFHIAKSQQVRNVWRCEWKIRGIAFTLYTSTYNAFQLKRMPVGDLSLSDNQGDGDYDVDDGYNNEDYSGDFLLDDCHVVDDGDYFEYDIFDNMMTVMMVVVVRMILMIILEASLMHFLEIDYWSTVRKNYLFNLSDRLNEQLILMVLSQLPLYLQCDYCYQGHLNKTGLSDCRTKTLNFNQR